MSEDMRMRKGKSRREIQKYLDEYKDLDVIIVGILGWVTGDEQVNIKELDSIIKALRLDRENCIAKLAGMKKAASVDGFTRYTLEQLITSRGLDPLTRDVLRAVAGHEDANIRDADHAIKSLRAHMSNSESIVEGVSDVSLHATVVHLSILEQVQTLAEIIADIRKGSYDHDRELMLSDLQAVMCKNAHAAVEIQKIK